MKPDAQELTDREIVEAIFYAIPCLRRFHSRTDPLFRFLDEKLVDFFDKIDDGRPGIGPFSELIWPRYPTGNLSSYQYFCFAEILFYAFYWRNYGIYKSFFDVGSHIGIDAIVASIIGYDVSCFEPDPDNFKLLKENIEINKRNNIKAYCKGISDKSGEAKFIRVKGNTTANHISGARDFYGDSEIIRIETTTFEEIGTFPDLMKINVEGYEKIIVPTIPWDVWNHMDAFIEIHNEENRNGLWRHFIGKRVNIFSQKIGWEKAETIEDVPKRNSEGYIFVSIKDVMPW